MKNYKFILLLFFIYSVEILQAQQLNLVCKEINVSYNENFSNLSCPIEICINQSWKCDSALEIGNCNIFPLPSNCVKIYPNGTTYNLCYFEQTSSNECNCNLVTNSITVTRYSVDGHGILNPIQSLDFFGSTLNSFMNILQFGTRTDLPLELTKDCQGNEVFSASIRISGNGNPQNPFIVLIP